MQLDEFRELCENKGYSEEQIIEFTTAITHGLNITSLVENAFMPECMHEIILGMLHHVDTDVYDKEELDAESMRYIRLGLEAEFPMLPYANGEYNARQLEAIYNGMLHHINVKAYDDSSFSAEKMYQSFIALSRFPEQFTEMDLTHFNELQLYQLTQAARDGLHVADIADPIYDDMQMLQLRLGLKSDVYVDTYSTPSFSAPEMEQIRIGLEHGVEVSQYAYSCYNAFQMKQLRLGLEQGLDISLYSNDAFSGKLMLLIRLGMLEGIEVSEYAIPGISDDKAQAIYQKLIDLQNAVHATEDGDFVIGNDYLELVGLREAESPFRLSSTKTTVGIANPAPLVQSEDLSGESGTTDEKNADNEEKSTEEVASGENKEESVHVKEDDKETDTKGKEVELKQVHVDVKGAKVEPLNLEGLHHLGKIQTSRSGSTRPEKCDI